MWHINKKKKNNNKQLPLLYRPNKSSSICDFGLLLLSAESTSTDLNIYLTEFLEST